MKAITQDSYGAPQDVMVLREVPRPVPGEHDVLIRVHATPVSGTDWHLVRGLPYVARPITGWRRPRSRIPGYDLAGTVVEAGAAVTSLRPGDQVYGWAAGTFAEYTAVPEKQLAPIPANLTLEQAAAVPIAAFTALQAVRDGAGLRPGGTAHPRPAGGPGRRVLITGASGGVGTYAVQFAKAYGAHVTGMCRTSKMDLVAGLGAAEVVDYTATPLRDLGRRFDLLIDLYGNPSLAEVARVLVPGGTIAYVGGTGGRWFMGTDRWLRAMVGAPLRGLKTRLVIHKDSHDDLVTITGMIESGAVRPVLDRTFPLAEAAEAIRYVTAGDVRGQAVLRCAD
ncbi:NAD(P)-dependent alcohol dehydrogenase [Micromonospora sp. NBC_01813]|uniref:NAD(P)-dependent alcohol dehydrogenase n=1 Tax=Micromonospora sp. NBC_01813 TaxID=2975988 RepID=UPI002DDABDC1|nr:NAD(P)-dependent alcohol dehydrogenase [Micromonospora sp. NBC_01813]WSA09284.1 NAD(P)-dependent alcohol dehydrogenase [Micromonospora sp. NBC_01813]